MNILGLNGGIRLGYQDTAAVLIQDGKVTAAVEEERMNRIKYAPGQLPELAIVEALKIGGLGMKDIDLVASHGETWGGDFEFWLRDYLGQTFGHCPGIIRVNHHNAHAASAFFGSGFDQAMILTIDASGDSVATQAAVGKDKRIDVLKRISRPNSLGIFYSVMTQYCGFRRDSDEYKLMGLAAYGDKHRYDLSDMLTYGNGNYELNTDYLKPIKPGQAQPVRQNMAFSEKLIEKLGPKRVKGQPLAQHYKNVAASAQDLLEQVLIDQVRALHKETGMRKLCLAGGVALNCMANKHLMNLDFVDDIYIQPAAGDAGVSLGAAMWAGMLKGEPPQAIPHVYLGSSYSEGEIETELRNIGVTYEKVDKPEQFAAKDIADNKIVGWYQGATEYGPRALGNRSILANPANPLMKDILNDRIKHREPFRPFAPSLMAEEFSRFFKGKKEHSPFMTINYEACPENAAKIPAVVHEDGTSRIQTVSEKDNPLYYKLLKEVKKRTGIGMVVNTSFNVNMQPIVNTPAEAVSTFYACGMDVLYAGPFMIRK